MPPRLWASVAQRVAIAARHQRQRAAVEGERLGVAPLRLAQDAEIVEHAGDVAIAGAEAASDLGAARSGSRDRRRRTRRASDRCRPAPCARLTVSRAMSGIVASGRRRRIFSALRWQRPPRAADRAPPAPGPARPARWRRPGGAGPRRPDSRRSRRGRRAPRPRSCPSARSAIARSCWRMAGISGSSSPAVLSCCALGMAASGPALYRLAPGCPRRRAASSFWPRRLFAPEVIQTSAMDCGPAALKCLLEGFGVGVSYGRLREACQTSVDGTSIDTLETLAQSLGLDAEQVMMPVDHLLLARGRGAARDRRRAAAVGADPLRRRVAGARRLGAGDGSGARAALGPARDASCATSTRTRCPFPRRRSASGRAATDSRRRSRAGCGRWASTTAQRAARARAGGPGLGGDRRRSIAPCARSRSWPSAGAVSRGRRGAPAGGGAGAWRCRQRQRRPRRRRPMRPRRRRRPRPTAASRSPCGARCCCACRGRRPLDQAQRAALPLELRAAVDEPRVRVGAALWRLLREAGVRWRALAAGVALAALGTVVEAVLFRALFEAAGRPMFAVVVALLASLLVLELPLAWGLRRAGAAIEERFRDLFLRKIPRLGDRYFQSRPVSDMAERAHLVHRLRALPTLAGDIARTALEIVIIAAALVWLDPRGAALAIALAAAMLLIPLGAQPAIAERDLRMRNHAGRAGALLSRRAAGAGDRADARRRAGAGARAPGSAARVGARGARVAARGAGGGGDAGAGGLRPRRPGCSRASSRARAGTMRARGCWPSTGRCRCRCSGTSWRCSSSRCRRSAA